MNLSKSYQELMAACNYRVLLLDGDFGLELSQMNLTEKDFRGQMFADHFVELKEDREVLSLTAPEKVKSIHRNFLAAGADLIRTNTFNANSYGQLEFRLQNMAYDISKAGAIVAKAAVEEYNQYMKTIGAVVQPKFVVGSIGPVEKSSFTELREIYGEQVRGLLDGGADALIVESASNALNVKAALYAILGECERRGELYPILVSATVTDADCLLPSGQCLEALWCSVSGFPIFSIGFNIAEKSAEVKPCLQQLKNAFVRVSGLLDPCEMENGKAYAEQLAQLVDEGLVNVVGGNSGATPEFIKFIAKVLKGRKPRMVPARQYELLLSGLSPMTIASDAPFVNVGNAMNVEDFRPFAKLASENKWKQMATIGAAQIKRGMSLVNVNLDDGSVDSKNAMVQLLQYMESEPLISKCPLVIGSSKWDVLLAAMETMQGKGIINHISLKDGEESFLAKASEIRKYGFAVMCKAIDESGVATTYARRVDVMERMYRLLVGRLSFPVEDILFDPFVLPIGSGIEKHANYGKDFLESCKFIKSNLPHARIVGKLSGLTENFKGDDSLRGMIQSVFHHHSVLAGMDFGLINEWPLPDYDSIPLDQRKVIEDLIFNESPDALEKLITKFKSNATLENPNWRELAPADKVRFAVLNGEGQFLEQDLAELRGTFENATDLVSQFLMEVVNELCHLISENKLFTAQVLKSVGVLEQIYGLLQDSIDKEWNGQKTSKVVLAAMKGDDLDLDKILVTTVLKLLNYQVLDLGNRCTRDVVTEAVLKDSPEVVCLYGHGYQGLMTMSQMAGELKCLELATPIVLCSGAATALYVAAKIAPDALGPAVYAGDAYKCAIVVDALCDKNKKEKFLQSLVAYQEKLRASC